MNCSGDRIATEPIVAGVELDLPPGGVTLAPYGVAVLETRDEAPAVVETTEGRDARV